MHRLFVFNVALKHLISRRCLLVAVEHDQCAATQECHAVDTEHNTPPRHSTQTQGRLVLYENINAYIINTYVPHEVKYQRALVKRIPLIWNVTLEFTTTHFNVLSQTRSGNPSPTFLTYNRERSTL